MDQDRYGAFDRFVDTIDVDDFLGVIIKFNLFAVVYCFPLIGGECLDAGDPDRTQTAIDKLDLCTLNVAYHHDLHFGQEV